MKNKNIKLILAILVGLAVIVYIIIFFNNAKNELSENPIKLERQIPTDYINLFNPQVQRNIVLQSATSFKLRSTIADAIYNNEYDIMITKVAVQSGFDLKNDIVGIYNKSEGAAPKTNSSYNEDNFRITYNGSSSDTISKVYLTLDGDSTANYYKNDSVIYYYSYLKAANLQYNHEGVNEITIEAKKSDQKKPIVIMFIKKNDCLYFIIMSGRKDDAPLSPNMLYEMIR